MNSTHPLPLTGERTVPGVPDEAYWFARHVVAYRLAGGRVAGAAVLDAGCGEGYGLQHLVQAGAARAIGVDLDAPAVAHAQRTYAEADSRITVEQCELMAIPLSDDEIDVTVSFQVIEHVHDIPGYLASLRRVTRSGGQVLIATPNRLTFTPGSDVPVNPFHVKEFTAAELTDELTQAGFEVTDVLGVHHGARLDLLATELGQPFTELMTTVPAAEWPLTYRRLVHTVTADDFVMTNDNLDASLDLVALCLVP
jgi:SAM-dependent methyltransferase